MRALIAIARLGRPVSGRLGIAVLLGLGAALAGIGLTATSAWLISRAAQQPPVLYLMIAITAVQAFGVSRGVLRYGERLAAHDAAFRVLARLRGQVYLRLERLAPAGLAAYRSGDLLARLVADVDGLADLWLRVLLPYTIVVIAATATTLLVGALVPVAGLVLGATLFLVAFVVPLAAGALGRAAERRLAPARGALAAAVTRPARRSAGAAGDRGDGPAPRRALAPGRRPPGRRAAGRHGRGPGGPRGRPRGRRRDLVRPGGRRRGAAIWCAGRGGPGGRGADTDGRPRAGRRAWCRPPSTCRGWAPPRSASRRCSASRTRLANRTCRRRCRPAPTACGSLGVGARYGDGPDILDGVDLELRGRGQGARHRPERLRQEHAGGGPAPLPRPVAGRSSSSRRRGLRCAPGLPATTSGGSSVLRPGRPRLRHDARRQPAPCAPGRDRRGAPGRAAGGPARRLGGVAARMASPRRSASTGLACPAASASGWPSPGPCWPTGR